MPHPLGPLVGRQREVAALSELLLGEQVRLVTLTGPGGVGKTRLALRLAEAIASEFAAGVTFVPLAAVTDPARVLPELARAFDLHDDAELTVERQLVARLQGGRRLLVLDNFEHVAAAGVAVSELAAMCPQMTVLVTSRRRLRLNGEHEFPVLPLSLPESTSAGEMPEPAALAENPAVALFVLRAVAAKPGFALTQANASAVAQVCRRLDGLPLAIELAAARSVVLSPQSMLARLTNRLQLLGDGPVDAPPRLRTMRDAVAWSLDLLSDEEQTLFRRLGVFAGAITDGAAEAVAGEIPVVPALSALVDAALLQCQASDDGSIRFRMLETVSEVARERLAAAGEADAAHLLVAERFRRLIKEAEVSIQAGGQDRWFEFLESEEDNIRATIDWAIRARRAGLALRLIVGPLWFFWSMRGRVRSERHWLEDALAAAENADPPVDPALRAKALFTDALYFQHTGDYLRARARLEASLAICRDLPDSERTTIPILSNLGVLDIDQGRYEEARGRFEAILPIRREIGDPSGTARTLVNLGNVAILQDDYSAATRFLEEALPLLRQTGERRLMAHCLNGLGEIAAGLGRDAEALASFDQALGLFRQAGDLIVEGTTLVNLAAASLRQGDLPRAAAALAEAFEQQREDRAPTVVADALDCAASVAVTAGRARLAPAYLGVAAAIRAVSQTVPSPAVRRRADRAVGAAKAALGRRVYDAEIVAARQLTAAEAIEQAGRFLTEIAPVSGQAIADESIDAHRPRTLGAPPPVALTRRQREVLRLLVVGLTDPEIGEELGIGARTVESHVATILNKLRVHARTAAVAYAVRHGLV